MLIKENPCRISHTKLETKLKCSVLGGVQLYKSNLVNLGRIIRPKYISNKEKDWI